MPKKPIKAKFIESIQISDPDTGELIEVEMYKLETGGIIGIDASFLETEMPVYSPFDKSIEIEFEE